MQCLLALEVVASSSTTASLRAMNSKPFAATRTSPGASARTRSNPPTAASPCGRGRRSAVPNSRRPRPGTSARHPRASLGRRTRARARGWRAAERLQHADQRFARIAFRFERQLHGARVLDFGAPQRVPASPIRLRVRPGSPAHTCASSSQRDAAMVLRFSRRRRCSVRGISRGSAARIACNTAVHTCGEPSARSTARLLVSSRRHRSLRVVPDGADPFRFRTLSR